MHESVALARTVGLLFRFRLDDDARLALEVAARRHLVLVRGRVDAGQLAGGVGGAGTDARPGGGELRRQTAGRVRSAEHLWARR